MDMSLSKLQEMVKDKEAWHAAVPVDHVLSELSTMTCPSWVALHSMAHSFIVLLRRPLHYDKAVIHEGAP